MVFLVGTSAVALIFHVGVPDKTYNKNGINFTYPGQMNENTTFMLVTNSKSNDTQYDTFRDDQLKRYLT